MNIETLETLLYILPADLRRRVFVDLGSSVVGGAV